MSQRNGIRESEFYMWRAVLAFALVDNVLSLEEQILLKTYLANVHLSTTQISILRNDFKTPQDVTEMYGKITDAGDRERFSVLARALTWCEGKLGTQEQGVMKKLSCLSRVDGGEEIFSSRVCRPDLHLYHECYARARAATRPKEKRAAGMKV